VLRFAEGGREEFPRRGGLGVGVLGCGGRCGEAFEEVTLPRGCAGEFAGVGGGAAEPPAGEGGGVAEVRFAPSGCFGVLECERVVLEELSVDSGAEGAKGLLLPIGGGEEERIDEAFEGEFACGAGLVVLCETGEREAEVQGVTVGQQGERGMEVGFGLGRVFAQRQPAERGLDGFLGGIEGERVGEFFAGSVAQCCRHGGVGGGFGEAGLA